MKRSLALLAAFALALTLSACGGDPAQPGPDPSAEPSAAPTSVPQDATVAILPDNETDVVDLILGFPEETVLLTVNGREITAEEYCYWLGNMTAYYEMMYASGEETLDLSGEVAPGRTWDDQLRDTAYQNCVLLAITDALAAQQGVSLSDEDLRDLASDRARNITSAGGDAGYAYQLQVMGINDATASDMDQTAKLLEVVRADYAEKTAAALTGEEVARYVQDNDLLRAKHILLLTRDMTTGERYDDEKVARQKAKAEDILAQVQADPAKFDELMQANSEDSGLSAYPDGYVFTAGEMVAPFEEGTRALDIGGISGLVESDYGYHIILRLDPDCDETRQAMAQARLEDMLQTAIDQAEVVKAPEYDAITAEGYYNQLRQFQKTLHAPTDDMSNAQLEPDTSATPEG